MIGDILLGLWFFAPAGLANMAPILVAHAPYLKRFNTPIDFGRKFRGRTILGAHKTWRGILAGTLAGILIISLQKFAYENYAWAYDISAGLDYSQLPIILGGLMGFGALAGDAIKSFFKRQFNHDSGDSWFPFDQLDYIIGGLLASLLIVRLEPIHYLLIFLIYFALHLISSFIGYKLKLKSKPI